MFQIQAFANGCFEEKQIRATKLGKQVGLHEIISTENLEKLAEERHSAIQQGLSVSEKEKSRTLKVTKIRD